MIPVINTPIHLFIVDSYSQKCDMCTLWGPSLHGFVYVSWKPISAFKCLFGRRNRTTFHETLSFHLLGRLVGKNI